MDSNGAQRHFHIWRFRRNRGSGMIEAMFRDSKAFRNRNACNHSLRCAVEDGRLPVGGQVLQCDGRFCTPADDAPPIWAE